jgi:hypothetical protein
VGTARIDGKDLVRQASPCEEVMQAFYYMHNIPSKEFSLAVIEQGPFTLVLDLPPREIVKVPRSGRVEVIVKATFKKGVKPGAIILKAAKIPQEWRVETSPILPGQTQSTIVITTFGNKAVHAGQRGALVLTATMKTGKTSVFGFVPVIPYEVH